MKNVLWVILLGFSSFANAQESTTEQSVIQTIKTLFDGMRAGDSTIVRSGLHPDAHLQSSFTNKEGVPVLQGGSIDRWVASVGTPHDEVYDEKIWSYKVRIDDNLASVWTDYTFYLGEKLSHCGVNAFHLANTADGWKIAHITDTRRRENCITEMPNLQSQLNELINNWHNAAATANEEVFFGSMTEKAIYIGTDATEKWERDEMQEWSKKYFDKESAWDFATIDRTFYFSDDEETAWFEESLDTWMGVCRGSGVLELTKDGWKIRHYHLSVAVPNEQIDEYLKIATPSSKLRKQ
ncbi:MAG: nuclear transport factor 2 family protein [Bacteroidota bacterium]